jgi:hypothetical protein
MREKTNGRNESQAFYVGLDLGQARDYTAVVVLEHVLVRTPERHEQSVVPDDRDEFHVRHVERLPLGTSYVDVIGYVTDLLRKIEQTGQTGLRPHLIVDATAVGRAIVDMFTDAGLEPVVVTVHGGYTEHCVDEAYRVPKRDLVASAKALLGRRQLKIAKEHPDADVLVNELRNYQVRVNIATGHDSYQAWCENAHDDLVFALCLASWYAGKNKRRAAILVPPVIVGMGQGRFAKLRTMTCTRWYPRDFPPFI